MTKRLKPYTGADRFNYLALLAWEIMGTDSLMDLPPLMGGFESVMRTLPEPLALAIRHIRHDGFAPVTRRELMLMIDAYRTHHRRRERILRQGERHPPGHWEQRFSISEDFRIAPRWSLARPEDATDALQALTSALAVEAVEPMPVHDPHQSGDIHGAAYNARVEPLGFEPPEPPRYPMDRLSRAPGAIPWTDLVEIANEFDRADVAVGRQATEARQWFHRLHDEAGEPTAQLLAPYAEGLAPADSIDLSGIKHLIGLPGAGKTTLLYLIAAYLFRHGYRACFLFSSIEVATAFIEKLEAYQVPVGLLSGQGQSARFRHVMNFATSLSGTDQGFGVTRSTDRFFATNCALAGFASHESEAFPHEEPPCQQLFQLNDGDDRARAHQCALASVCGYQYAERHLAETPLWAGHVLSMDRQVSRLFRDAKLRHFEYIARTFDLLVIDECDGAQTNLDERGTPIMKLVGDDQSLWFTLIQDIHQPAAGGHNAFFAGDDLPSLTEMTGRFGRASERLVGRIAHLPKRIRDANANDLLTALSLLSDMYAGKGADEAEAEAHYRARQSLERLWDNAVKRVAFRHQRPGEDEDEDQRVDRETLFRETAQGMGVSTADMEGFYNRLLEAIEAWDRDGRDAEVRALAEVLREAPALTSPMDAEDFFYYTGLLVSVSLVVLQHFGLAPHLRLMNAAGMVSDEVFASRPSRDQMACLPESLAGRLSGVRYVLSEEGNVEVSHVGFAGAPRLLPRRMMHLGREAQASGMAVLLSSATSMLEASPSYHINAGPDYVLQRTKADEGWKDSRYTFLPRPDHGTGQGMLRFSGAPLHRREAVLKSMVDSLLADSKLGHLAQAIRTNDVVDELPRKGGFVVNSYAQCQWIYDHIQAHYPEWRSRVRYLTRSSIHGARNEHALTASEVETLGHDPHWDLLIFPMNAIGRGVNIVFPDGPRANQAAIGSLYFLTRPHPRSDSLQLIQGLIGRASEAFDQREFAETEAALTALQAERRVTTEMAEHLLRTPLVAQRLGDYARPFVADQMIMILQTIGRAMRGDRPAFVYFVDAAWAPRSAEGQADTPESSMLVMMQSILEDCLFHADPGLRACYRSLYESFAHPLRGTEGLIKAHA